MEALFRQAVQTPLPLDPCQMTDCVFYTEHQYCSKHRLIPILNELHHRLPSALVRRVGEMLQNRPRRPVSDTELDAILGDQIVWEEDALVDERCFFLQHHVPAYFSCDDLDQAEQWLGLSPRPLQRHLKAAQAVRLMTAIETRRNISAYPMIAMQKVLVQRTAHTALLPVDMFSVGLCYHGRSAFLSTMDPNLIRNLWGRRRRPIHIIANEISHDDHDGGGGGGGGGVF